MSKRQKHPPPSETKQASSGPGPEPLTDEDVLEAMKELSGYLDITPGDFRELYALAYAHAHRRILSRPARDIMTSPVHFVLDDQPVLDVAHVLARHEVAGVPVLSKADQTVAGVISEKDFMRRMAEAETSFMGLVAACMSTKGCPALKVKGKVAADIMSSPAETLSPEAQLCEVFELMREKRINRVPIVEEGRLVGIVSRDDVLEALRHVPGGEGYG